MRRRSLKKQFALALRKAERFGTSKRANKRNGVKTYNYIYSISSFRDLKKRCDAFSNFLETNHPEVKWVKDIKPEHLQEYVNLNSYRWSKATTKLYRYHFRKIAVLCNRAFGCNLNFFPVQFKTPRKGKIKDHPMAREDFEKLVEVMHASKSKAFLVPEMTASIGTRTQEITLLEPYRINLEAGVVELRHCKNGRHRNVPIRPRDLAFWKEVKKYAIDHNWNTVVGGITKNSVSKALRNAMAKAGISHRYPFESNHAIRKMYARERFAEEQERGFNIESAWITVQQELGHGNSARPELFRVYIGRDYKQALTEEKKLENN